MRLDHLLSREQAKAERPELKPRSIQRAKVSCEEAARQRKARERERGHGRKSVGRAGRDRREKSVDSVSFSGFGETQNLTVKRKLNGLAP